MPTILSFLFLCFSFALVGVCTYSSDLFLSSRPRTGLATRVVYTILGMVEARLVNVKKTTTLSRLMPTQHSCAATSGASLQEQIT